MSAQDLSGQAVQQLVEKFLALSLAKGDAIMGDQIAKANRLYWRIDAIKKELRSREGDQRRALRVLYDHPNAQVRLEAANATLVPFPDEARAALQMICDRHEFPQAASAGFMLLNLHEGRFVPE